MIHLHQKVKKDTVQIRFVSPLRGSRTERVKRGNNVTIGAYEVVTHNILDNAVAVGIPVKVISYDDTSGYVNRQA